MNAEPTPTPVRCSTSPALAALSFTSSVPSQDLRRATTEIHHSIMADTFYVNDMEDNEQRDNFSKGI